MDLIALSLVACSFLASFTTAALGIGGGTFMLAVMAQLLPSAAIIPVHAAVQLGSNAGRTALLLTKVDWSAVIAFSVGALIGISVSAQWVIALSTPTLMMCLGLFILSSVWLPQSHFSQLSRLKLGLGGTLTTALSSVVGATGPLVLGLVRAHLRKDGLPAQPPRIVATAAACLSLQHTVKLILFGALGFQWWHYSELIALMIAAGLVGTFLGKKVLLKTHASRFDLWLKCLLSVLALRLLYVAGKGYLGW